MRYYLISVLSVFAAILLGSLARSFSPRWDNVRINHSWNAVPENWEGLGNPRSGTTIDLYVALKAHHEKALIDKRYTRLRSFPPPPPGTLELVNSWLEHHGVPSSSVSMTYAGTTLTLSGMSIIQANALLGASYQLYRHVRADCSADDVLFHPQTQWRSPYKRSGGGTAGLKKPVSGEPMTVLSSSADDDDTTPSFLLSLYKKTEYRPAAPDRIALGVVGMLNDYPSPDDLGTFMSVYCSDGTDASITVVQVNGGGYDPTKPTYEANLDTQHAVAMTYPTPVIFYSTGREPAGTTDWVSYVHDERLIPEAYAAYICTRFSMLGVLGVSVLIATGDDGFYLYFPATCSYVTAVGGTTGHEPETAASLSGGLLEHLSTPRLPGTGRDKIPLAPCQLRYEPGNFRHPAHTLVFPVFTEGEKYHKCLHARVSLSSLLSGSPYISLLNDYLISQDNARLP
ncbi:hypothetical protein EDB87DRAFT_1684699 [Lactarius vividus]|nr:hypothetical protein EDB87DRAFT_1684699 [Lactarius vividus]